MVGNATSHLPPVVAANMPTQYNLKKTVQRVRHAMNPAPAAPTSLAELEIPDDLTVLEDGTQFLLHDSGPETGQERFALDLET